MLKIEAKLLPPELTIEKSDDERKSTKIPNKPQIKQFDRSSNRDPQKSLQKYL